MLCNYGYFFAAFVLDVGQLTQSFFSSTTSSRCLVSSDKSRMSTHQHSTTPLGLVKTSSADLTEHPGDPSLILTTNVDLGERKLDVMKACSKAIAEHTGKPESYVAVAVTDNASLIFGGSDAPAAVGCMYSIGGISQLSNGFITSAVSDALSPFHVPPERIYINFFDVPRANVGWNRRTFAG